ncbi:hypothetical protein [Parasedimentitalea huanghaiensis]|uniref:Limonene hydroxylase n=1 Tax=Parasedimentitalea huanghaiensis TaxID=2682100 RepID=A0A6L6WD16_9RHOB|nr:hypothetical protein [Zongyanglinia huanghaiensis]MVO14475.1 hypothetical protein [Zongyanglinia huanghaiensis]
MFNFFKKPVWPPNFKNPPWGDRKSIYDHIAEHINPERHEDLSEGGYRLPDEPEADPNSISFASGAMDGMFGHHGSSKIQDEIVSDLHAALMSACENASDRNVHSLYRMFKDSSALEVVDPLVKRIHEQQVINGGRIREIVYWFTTKAADREPVKLSMALLGLLREVEDSKVFLTLGRHDEFTLFSAVAISNNESYNDEVLWQLAKSVEGWGRISTVERLTDTNNPEIKDWLLRSGFKNSIMYEYLACICARAGELHLALQRDEIDSELFNSASELIDTLVSGEGGPAEGLADYEHGCAAVSRLLAHGEGKFSTASHYRFLWKLKERVGEYLSGERQIEQDWSQSDAKEIAEKLDKLLSCRDWKEVIIADLKHGDRQAFWDASRACEKLGVDPWPHFVNRTKAGEDYWWDLMRRSDPSRIDEVLALGMEKIPLDDIATGPSNKLGLGIEYASHTALDFILRDLGDYPGKGWAFVEAGLQSPVVRNRIMALKALSVWRRENWPEGTEVALQKFMGVEPETDVKKHFNNLIAGRNLD